MVGTGIHKKGSTGIQVRYNWAQQSLALELWLWWCSKVVLHAVRGDHTIDFDIKLEWTQNSLFRKLIEV